MDGIVDGLDFIDWNSNKFLSADATGRADVGASARASFLVGIPHDSLDNGRDAVRLVRGPTDRPQEVVDTDRFSAEAQLEFSLHLFAPKRVDESGRTTVEDRDLRRHDQLQLLDRFFAIGLTGFERGFRTFPSVQFSTCRRPPSV